MPVLVQQQSAILDLVSEVVLAVLAAVSAAVKFGLPTSQNFHQFTITESCVVLTVSAHSLLQLVVPVELTAAAGPVERAVVKNPFFKKNKSKAVSVLETVDEDPASTKNKSTRVINRFFGLDREVVGSILHASFDVQGN